MQPEHGRYTIPLGLRVAATSRSAAFFAIGKAAPPRFRLGLRRSKCHAEDRRRYVKREAQRSRPGYFLVAFVREL
jgi:hypothetical protein